MTQDQIQLAIDALEFYADFDPDRERGLYGEEEFPGIFLLDEGEKAKHALEQLRALQSQPAAAHGVEGLEKYASLNPEKFGVSVSGHNIEIGNSPALPADKQAALDEFKFLETYLHQIGSWEIVSDKIMSIKAALTAPQPVADLEGLKDEASKKLKNFSAEHLFGVYEFLDHLHATGRLTTSADVQELKDENSRLKRTIAGAALCILEGKTGINDTIWFSDATTLFEHLVSEIDVDLTGDVEDDIQTLKHAATIAKVKGE